MMFSHEYFHEQAHVERCHELKRHVLLFAMLTLVFVIYRLFCRHQEFEADRLAAGKCGKEAACESLMFLQMSEKKRGFLADMFSLHPRTEKRIKAFI